MSTIGEQRSTLCSSMIGLTPSQFDPCESVRGQRLHIGFMTQVMSSVNCDVIFYCYRI